MFLPNSLACAVAGTFVATCGWAEEPPKTPDTVVAPVVVTATRSEQNSFDLPVSIDAISGETLREGQLQVNLSESAVRVPGVVVNNRNNPAQDLAIQVRGFGARSAFGVRGVRLYADGIPMTMPDGQGQTGTFNLDTAKSVEFLRGPFSALYGNSSGGVVQIFTQDGTDEPVLSGGATFGSYNTRRGSLTLGGDNDGFNYIVNGSTFRTDGYRDHSEARRDTVHGKIKANLGKSTSLTIVATALDQPDNNDPQGLTPEEYRANPKQASQAALTFDTRVSRSHEQVGATLEHRLTAADTLRVMGYFGRRQNEQFLSTAIGAQTGNDLNGGGVSTIDRDFGGVDLRWEHAGKIAELPYTFTAGLNYDQMNDARKGYENFVGGSGTVCGASGRICGVKGALRRDEDNDLFNFDEYLQASVDLHPRWTVSGGIRHSKVNFKARDRFTRDTAAAGINGDDSGSVTYTETTPVIGAVFRFTDSINLYANAGKSFETPTFVELSYSPTGSGLNFGLKPATSRQYEVGAKAVLSTTTLVNLALFKIKTDDEIVVFQQVGGRTVYQNVPSTERKGLELALDSRPGHGLGFYLAYSLLDAEFTSPFQACNIPGGAGTTTCNPATPGNLETIRSGGNIPGTYRHTLYGEASWKHRASGFSTAIEMRKFSKTYVNFDSQDGAADGYTVFNWRGGFSQQLKGWSFSEFLRIENLFAQKYVGSVRVADLQRKFFEPAPPRNWLFGLNAGYQF
ncbi:MAG TPA: TonB-dependent receptor [Novimethylophilus sp.]|jgi:iron complex outermembrane receptor protein|uniref:TonB-dependent receptor family protein n=1 Tax=Novimethylophilus sp. TaxID=2137426 RepID=UPI002F42D03D